MHFSLILCKVSMMLDPLRHLVGDNKLKKLQNKHPISPTCCRYVDKSGMLSDVFCSEPVNPPSCAFKFPCLRSIDCQEVCRASNSYKAYVNHWMTNEFLQTLRALQWADKTSLSVWVPLQHVSEWNSHHSPAVGRAEVCFDVSRTGSWRRHLWEFSVPSSSKFVIDFVPVTQIQPVTPLQPDSWTPACRFAEGFSQKHFQGNHGCLAWAPGHQ